MKTLKIIKKEYQRIGYDENDIQPVEYLEVSAQYNDHGQILREERFDPDGNLNTLTVNSYNDNNLLWKTEQYDMDNILLQKTVNEYDDRQQLVQENNFFGDSDQVYVTKLIYDEDGNLLRREMYFEGKLDYVENIYEYKDGLLVKEVENDEYGKELNVHTYTYNDKGLLARHVRDEVQNKDRRSYEYTYDDNDNCIKELVYDYDNALIAKVYRKYNENGKIVETEEEDLDHYRKITLEYDGDFVVKNSILDRDGNLQGWAEYSYNEDGKENASREFIKDEVQPDHFRQLRETRYVRE